MGATARTVQQLLEDLRARLRTYRAVAVSPGFGWERGVDHEYLADLLTYWTWTARSDSDTPLRAIHRPAADTDAAAVVLLHGWPDSVLRFDKLLPLLTDLNLVVPALPGFPFAAPVTRRGLSAPEMASAIAAALARLGYDRYVVSAGDVGCDVAEALAAAHPDRVAALHLTDVSQYHFLVDPPQDLSDAERAYVRHGQRWQANEGGYMHEQSTKPHTLAVGLGDSPAGRHSTQLASGQRSPWHGGSTSDKNRPFYVFIGVTVDGHRDILGIWAGEGGEGGSTGCTCSARSRTAVWPTRASWSATGSRAFRSRSPRSGRGVGPGLRAASARPGCGRGTRQPRRRDRRIPDGEPEDLAPAVGAHTGGDHHGLRDNPVFPAQRPGPGAQGQLRDGGRGDPHDLRPTRRRPRP